uniref:Uncharacterized protein n=1 Tax=Rangifer tarandus platyrhynchus TaxID=3082113 RepID=A0ACB0E0D5_RANTA|nr:unnamed protein product [Rangifer tarandus platyrhynchus]
MTSQEAADPWKLVEGLLPVPTSEPQMSPKSLTPSHRARSGGLEQHPGLGVLGQRSILPSRRGNQGTENIIQIKVITQIVASRVDSTPESTPASPSSEKRPGIVGSVQHHAPPSRQGLGSVTPEAGVQGSPEGASSQGKRLRPTAVTEVAGGGGGSLPQRGPSLCAAGAARSGKVSASATRPRLHLLVVLRRASTASPAPWSLAQS